MQTDDNDLTYFIVAQTGVIRRAIDELHSYIDRKSAEVRQAKAQLRALELFNHRQADLLHHALKHPHHEYTIDAHRKSHNVVYQTARNDLIELACKGCLIQSKRGKKMVFSVPHDLVGRLKRIEPSLIAQGSGPGSLHALNP